MIKEANSNDELIKQAKLFYKIAFETFNMFLALEQVNIVIHHKPNIYNMCQSFFLVVYNSLIKSITINIDAFFKPTKDIGVSKFIKDNFLNNNKFEYFISYVEISDEMLTPNQMLQLQLNERHQKSRVDVEDRLREYYKKFSAKSYKKRIEKIKQLRNKAFAHFDQNVYDLQNDFNNFFIDNKLYWTEVKNIVFDMMSSARFVLFLLTKEEYPAHMMGYKDFSHLINNLEKVIRDNEKF